MTKNEIIEDLQRAHHNLTQLIENDLSIDLMEMSKLDDAETYRLLKIDTDAHNLANSMSSLIKILQPEEENDNE